MAMEITNNYGSYAAQSMAVNNAANGAGKKETNKASQAANQTTRQTTGQTAQTAGSSKSNSASDYANELSKLVPSVEFRVGNSFASDETGQTLTVNPKLLEKMRNDPEKEKEMKELIKGVEAMTQLSESLNKATGWKTVFRHSYIDENGKYCHIALIRNEFMLDMSDKLREERRENAEKLLEKQKEKAAEKAEELEEKINEKQLEEKENAKAEEKSAEKSDYSKAEKLLAEKVLSSKDGTVYMNDEEFKEIIEVVKEDKEGSTDTKAQPQAGANLDIRI